MGLLSSALAPVAVGMTAAELVADVGVYVVRMALKIERLLDEVLGLVSEIRIALPQVVDSLESVSRSAENLHLVTPVIATLPTTQQDVRSVVDTLENLVGLATLGIDQLEAIPGARMVRRRITKALSDQKTG